MEGTLVICDHDSQDLFGKLREVFLKKTEDFLLFIERS